MTEATSNDASVILIVDDDEDTRGILVRMVGGLGINVLEAGHGREALAILKKQKVDVVLSDLVMPQMSGIMLLHSMVEQGHHMPFILITGFSDKDSAIQALRLGAFDYLEKPVHETDLLSVLGEALKVGREQVLLVHQVEARGSPLQAGGIDRSAEVAIMKMRTFRFKGETHDYTISRGNTETWHDLKMLFIDEAQQQLVFSEGALADLLKNPETLARDLGFVLRVVQSVRMASEAIRLTDIAEMAWSLESAIAAVKHVPSDMTAEHVSLMVCANRILHAKVTSLADRLSTDIQKSLDQLTESLRQVAATRGVKTSA